MDGVRGLAILGVLLTHGYSHGGFPELAPGGHLGVTVFFVLSGFLITTLLLDEFSRGGEINLSHFYLRRAARLLPALLVLLPFHALIWSFSEPVGTVALAFIPLLLYVTNMVRAFHLMPMAGTTFGWSLAVEEQFYAGWPPLVKRVLERGRTLFVLVAVCLGVIVLAVVLRTLLIDVPGWRGWIYFSTFTRFDALAIGCLAALARWRFRLPLLGLAGWLGAAWLGYAYLTYHADLDVTYVLGLPTTSLATAAVLLTVVHHAQGRLATWFGNRFLVRLGVISYGLYLWNLLPLQAWRIFTGDKPGVVGTVVCLALGYGAAEISYRLVELPVMRWTRSRLRGERRPLWSVERRAPQLSPAEIEALRHAELRTLEVRTTLAVPMIGTTIR